MSVRPEVLRLHAEGLTSAAIARAAGCSREWVRKILLTEGLTPNFRAVPSDDECVALYDEGLTHADIGREFTMSRDAIRYRCKRAGARSRSGPTPILIAVEVARVLDLARQGMRQADIAAEFGVTQTMISSLCRKHGIRRHAVKVRR